MNVDGAAQDEVGDGGAESCRQCPFPSFALVFPRCLSGTSECKDDCPLSWRAGRQMSLSPAGCLFVEPILGPSTPLCSEEIAVAQIDNTPCSLELAFSLSKWRQKQSE